MPASSFLIGVLVLFISNFLVSPSAGNFTKHVDLLWGEERARILDGGQLITLSLDEWSGSGFQSKDEYLFGRIDMDLKLVPGDSAGTVTAYYLSSLGPRHDEVDFEFLGNVSGQPYIVHTNVFTLGHGGREQQFYMWFDPTEDFHTYSIVWNPLHIIFLVDDIPIRVYNNNEEYDVPFPTAQPMRLYSSIWNAESWATQQGKVKINWEKAPFTASYKNFKVNACVWTSKSSCDYVTHNFISLPSSKTTTWMNKKLDAKDQKNLKWVQEKYMIYNYCNDYEKHVNGIPFECKL